MAGTVPQDITAFPKRLPFSERIGLPCKRTGVFFLDPRVFEQDVLFQPLRVKQIFL